MAYATHAVKRADTSATMEGTVLLTLAFGFLILSNGRFAVPVAAWVAPVLLLRFFRRTSVGRGMLLVYAAAAIAFVVAWRGWIPVPDAAFFGMAAGLAFLQTLPYLADRLAFRRLPRAAAALVLPTGMVTINFAVTLASPYGSWGDIAYAQAGHLALLQVLSVAGLHGVTFLIYWSAAAVADVWERGPSWKGLRFPAVVLVGVLVTGGLRLGLSDRSAPTARVASVIADHDDVFSLLDRIGFDLTSPAETPPEVQRLLRPHHENLLALTEQEARAGAVLVAWSEAGAVVREPEEAALVAQVAAIAERYGTYVVMGLATYKPGEALSSNKLIAIDPSGSVMAEYLKTKVVPGDQNVRGDGKIVLLDTPFGRIAPLICFDLDFPSFVRRAGRAGADVVVAPSNDWREIDPYHSRMAAFRAVENGVAVVRPTRNGRSLAVDAYGQTLSETDHFTTSPHVMVSSVPTVGVATVYSSIGDLFAWGCAFALVALLATAIRGRTSEPPLRQTPDVRPLAYHNA